VCENLTIKVKQTKLILDNINYRNEKKNPFVISKTASEKFLFYTNRNQSETLAKTNKLEKIAKKIILIK